MRRLLKGYPFFQNYFGKVYPKEKAIEVGEELNQGESEIIYLLNYIHILLSFSK